MTDEELMVAYREGDETAFWELYRRYSGRVYGFLVRRAGRPAADDLFQTVFLKLHRFRHRYDATFAFAPWLFTITRTSWVDHARKAAKLREEGLPEQLPAPAPPEERENPDLSVLNDRQREAIRLRYDGELSFEEISRRLKTSPGNVRQLVSRGIRRLKGNR